MQTFPESINSTESTEYSIVRLSKDNLNDISRLHAVVYDTTVRHDYFQKKYNTAYTGLEYIGFIAYNHKSIPIAYYGVIPCFIQYGNKTILAAQSADTMTHPQYRYKGMFVELSNRAFDLCRQLGIRLIFGFPNQNSYHGAVSKLGWKMTGTMTCFTIPIKALPLEAAFKKMKLWQLYKKYCGYILRKKILPFEGISNSVITDAFAGVHRNGDYLNYKIYSSSKVIAIDNVKVWIKLEQGLLIGDIKGINKKNFNGVIIQLKKIAVLLGLRKIQFHCSYGTSLHQLFATTYQPTPSFPVLFQDFGSGIPLEKIKFTFADIDIF